MEAVGMSSVDHPGHYRRDTGHEAIDAIEAWGLGFCLGNTVKYIARAGRKGDALEDLLKARWYLDRAIADEKGREPEEEPMPMEGMRFMTDGPDPLEVSVRGNRVRIRHGDGDEFLPPEDARSLADAVERGYGWASGRFEAMFFEDGEDGKESEMELWVRIGAEACVLTEAQVPIFASVLREMADEAEEKAHE